MSNSNSNNQQIHPNQIFELSTKLMTYGNLVRLLDATEPTANLRISAATGVNTQVLLLASAVLRPALTAYAAELEEYFTSNGVTLDDFPMLRK